MDLATFSGATHWVLAHGYWLMFLAMLIEGPIVTAAAAFAVALGYFNLPTVFILSLLGDLVADVVYYAIGYWSRGKILDRFGPKMGLSKERMQRLGRLLNEHSIKTLIALKLAPVIPTPGLMLVGATRMPLRRFTIISLLITLPKSILFMLAGFYFGKAYDTISHYFNYGGYIIVLVIALTLLVNYLYQKISARLSKQIEKV